MEVARKYTGGRGADVATEAVGIPATFELYTELMSPRGPVANNGRPGKPVTLHLEKLWTHNFTITTRLVDTNTISQLMKLVAFKPIDPTPPACHTFWMDEFMKTYKVFGQAAANDAVKVVVKQ